jgi:lysyl-tRNA synthetase class 2
MAYADYTDLMQIAEDLLSKMALLIKGSYQFKYYSSEVNEEIELDFAPPFQRIDMISELEKCIGEKIPDNYESEETQLFLLNACDKFNVKCDKPKTIPRLFDKLVGHFLEPRCKNPTFIINHPLIMSPLAKWHRADNRLTERFELFANYFELCNAYTELNDPQIQRKTFEKQMIDKKNGDLEAQEIDETFIDALEIGLPPTGGFGLGIERLIMLLCDKSTIHDVIAFPSHS